MYIGLKRYLGVDRRTRNDLVYGEVMDDDDDDELMLNVLRCHLTY